MRTLLIVLGDQLDLDAAGFDGFDPLQDAVWMAEVPQESEHVWSAKQRIAMFLSGMRHFAIELRRLGRPLQYVRLEADRSSGAGTLAEALTRAVEELRPQRLVMTAPGEWRVLEAIKEVAARTGLELDIREDRHFFGSVREFAAYAKAHKQLRLEYFYREMRRKHAVLMDGTAPLGGQWNFDKDNRSSFGARGPGSIPARATFAPDAVTLEVIDLVKTTFAAHPGMLDEFEWPVTRAEALQALQEFVTHRLPAFGRYQDAMWAGEAWGYHSQLSAALNLKLLNPREVVAAAEAAHAAGTVPLSSAEGFIRQILGWREYVRGIYWTRMPRYLELNGLDAHDELPPWYWTGATDMACLRDAIGQTLRSGYAHHIQRLMVTGLYTLLLGVEPRRVHEWYLAVYVDAVEWVELPNTLGMSQYADGGFMGSKPYAASGRYIERMSNLCTGCRYDPGRRTGSDACPFTTLYWDFLTRHRDMLAANPRMAWQLKHLQRLEQSEAAAIAARAADIRRGAVGGLS